MILVIKCPKCGGPMWEEALPDTDRVMDLACIICGNRNFYSKDRYMKWRRKYEKSVEATSNRRTLSPKR